jgi:hypothetical protein
MYLDCIIHKLTVPLARHAQQYPYSFPCCGGAQPTDSNYYNEYNCGPQKQVLFLYHLLCSELINTWQFIQRGTLHFQLFTSDFKLEEQVLMNKKIDAQFLLCMFIYFDSPHVLSNPVLIIRRVNCINTTSGICHSV